MSHYGQKTTKELLLFEVKDHVVRSLFPVTFTSLNFLSPNELLPRLLSVFECKK